MNSHSRSKESEKESETVHHPKELTFIERIIQCFSLTDNLQLIMSTGKPPNAVPVVDGLKYVAHQF